VSHPPLVTRTNPPARVQRAASPLVVLLGKVGIGLDYNVSQGGLIKAKQEFSLKILVDKKIIGCNFFI